MNIDAGSLEFAHARIWARWGQRADEWVWHRIEVTRDLGAVLELVRSGPLARWIAELGPDASPHAIEHALRRQWRERVAEPARWMPPAWRAAIEWCALLVDLPLLQHLARGGPLPGWTADDGSLRVLHEAPGTAADPLLSLLAAARADPARIGALWLAQWRRRVPHGPSAAGRDAIEAELVPLLARHAEAFGAPDAVDGWGLRQALHGRLVTMLRRALVQPVAAFVHLGLTALEGERLRAELVARATFPHRAPAGALR
jgi:hypothetical protein